MILDNFDHFWPFSTFFFLNFEFSYSEFFSCRFDTSGSMKPRLVPEISPCDAFCDGRVAWAAAGGIGYFTSLIQRFKVLVDCGCFMNVWSQLGCTTLYLSQSFSENFLFFAREGGGAIAGAHCGGVEAWGEIIACQPPPSTNISNQNFWNKNKICYKMSWGEIIGCQPPPSTNISNQYFWNKNRIYHKCL